MEVLGQKELDDKPISIVTTYSSLQAYLVPLPGSMREEKLPARYGSAETLKRCAYKTQSLRATSAPFLLDVGVDIIKMNELLGPGRQPGCAVFGEGLSRKPQ
jgi:hypothetical protein